MQLHELIVRQEASVNLVWQVTELPQLHGLLSVIDAAEDDAAFRPLIYLMFVPEEQDTEDVRAPEPVDSFRVSSVWGALPARALVMRIPLSHRFERFMEDIYRTVQAHAGALFLFDCFSELQEAWSTDMMVGNFFCLITPLIRATGSRAMYPLIRGRHSVEAIADVQEDTDLFLELFSGRNTGLCPLYLRARKLPDTGESALDPACYRPHVLDREERRFTVVRDGVQLAAFHQILEREGRSGRVRNMDYWDRYFERAQRDFADGHDMTETCRWMCRVMLTRDPKMRALIEQHFTPEDYFFIKEHMVGTGLIGGKACGMLTARKITENLRPDIYARLEPHDSFFVGSDVFYTYLVENGLWDLRIRQQSEEEYFTAGSELEERLANGIFPRRIEEELVRILEYYGHSPVIVRSSSILEDGFGNAFAGKYESVFCANTGTREERLREFENAIRTVYASMMNPSALEYRRRRGLDRRDEQMSLLIQRVSGAYYGDYFMPCAAGVGYSYSAYRFLEKLDPAAGMLRLVMGLGTMAVDRTEGSHPRLVSLDSPEVTPFHSTGAHHTHAQRQIGVVNCTARRQDQIALAEMEGLLPQFLERLLLSHDTEAERRFRERGRRRKIRFISCDGLVARKRLMQDLKEILHLLEKEYGNAVDLEFAVNLSGSGDYVINLLQCRPLQAMFRAGQIRMPEKPMPETVLLDCRKVSMGNSCEHGVDYVIYVDPVRYYQMPHHEKHRIAKLIHAVNRKLRGQDKKIVLMVPGRIGTSSPELGVPVVFADISEISAVFELAESRAGYQPELSYGSHFFQDLVEADILYTAVFEDERTVQFHPERLQTLPNLIETADPQGHAYADIIGLYDLARHNCRLYHDLGQGRMLITLS